MIKKKFILKNKFGLHARPAAFLVEIAIKSLSKITISKDGTEVSGKEVMRLLLLACECGDEILIKVDGKDEAKAMEAIIELLQSNFNKE